MALIHKNVLLVEGVQEVRVIPELIEANGIDWGTKKNPIVYIRDNVGYWVQLKVKVQLNKKWKKD